MKRSLLYIVADDASQHPFALDLCIHSTVYIQRIHYGFGAVEFNRKKNNSIEHKTLFRSLSSVNYTEH